MLLVAKAAGVTSHDVVADVKRRLGTKVGHAGTLDPFATGLLLMLVGQATRAQRFLMALPKTYRAVARLGWTSDTGDRDGDRVGLELEVSSGTYVRQLVADFGDAYCEELERTAVGPFRLEDAESFVPLGEALSFLPGVELAAEDAERASHGVAVPGTGEAEAVRLTHEGRLVAIARPEAETLKPFVVFHA